MTSLLKTRSLAIRAAAVLVVVGVMIAGCTVASPASASPTPASASPTPQAASAAASTDAPDATPTPLAGLPPEIVGIWRTDLREFHEDVCLPCGPVVRLTIEAHGSWQISRSGGGAAGGLSVRGSQIVFGPSGACNGTGVYEWHVEADTLTFTSVEADECDRRAEALNGPTYSLDN
jgi:hypothetical protein